MTISLSRRSISTICALALAAIALAFGSWAGTSRAEAPAAGFDEKVVYHVDDPAQVRMTLANVANHLQVSPKAKIAVLANGKAISMMAVGEHSAAIAELQAKGVRFLACRNSMNAFGIDEAKLVPGAVPVPSGVAELSRLQGAEHYAYIKP
jgi:hypothetical protein